MILALILLAALLLSANATFVAAEFATIAARRRLPRTLAALQLGISAASIGLGFTLEAIVETAVAPVIGYVPVALTVAVDAGLAVLAITIVSSLHTLFGEMVPKNLAISAPERLARWLALPTSAAVWLATPFVPVVWGSTRLLLRTLRIETPDRIEVATSADEIRTVLEASRAEGTIGAYDERLLSRILAFSQMRVTQVMVAWADVVTVPSSSTVADLERVGRSPFRGRHGVGCPVGGDRDDAERDRVLDQRFRRRPLSERAV